MSRTGKSARDIFASTTKKAPTRAGSSATEKGAGAQKSAPAKPMGRPPVHEESWTKVTVALLDRQIVYLDQLSLDLRAATGAAVSRSELLREMVDALQAAGVDFKSATAGADLKALLATKIRK